MINLTIVVLNLTEVSQYPGAVKLMSAFPEIKDYKFASFLSSLLTYRPGETIDMLILLLKYSFFIKVLILSLK